MAGSSGLPSLTQGISSPPSSGSPGSVQKHHIIRPVAMLHLADGRRMSSTLVETVSINYEDFNDSFLTCGTCLCMYDGLENTPKLLPCSHTVCRSCLERIVDAQSRDNVSFRCPICRETIQIPRGGVVAFPPSFIVNQLLDLMAAQRRDIIPKCSEHPRRELFFCENCDTVFCVDCNGGSHNGRGAGTAAHTVIPFSIAIKRMSEILLYKASLCMRNLDNAADIVNEEMSKLDVSAELCIDQVSKTFEDLINVIAERKMDVIQMVKTVRDDKKRVLREQLDIIQSEKTKVEEDCQGLQTQIEVRNITKKISSLNEQLDVTTTLLEPRENAFMKFEFKHNAALCDMMNALNAFGRIRISKTFPALCSAQLDTTVSQHLHAEVSIVTVDYHGNPRTSGYDPIQVSLVNVESRQKVEVDVVDSDNGLYKLSYTPTLAGEHTLTVTIFNRPIRDSPFSIIVTEHINPIHKIGGRRGAGNTEFIQPVNLCASKQGFIAVLDAGNSRIKILNSNLSFVRHLSGPGMEQHCGVTGIALNPTNNNILVVNWRTKYVTELNQEGDVIRTFTCKEFREPTLITANTHGEVIVGDTALCKLLVFNSEGVLINKIGSRDTSTPREPPQPGRFKAISDVYACPDDSIIVCDTRLQVFTRQGLYVQDIQHVPPGGGKPAPGKYGGVALDGEGCVLATRTEKGRGALIQVFSPDRQLSLEIDSQDDKLLRPSGITALRDGRLAVADLGNDCVKVYKYK